MDSHDKAFILVTAGFWIIAIATFTYTMLNGMENALDIFLNTTAVTAMQGTLYATRHRLKKKRGNPSFILFLLKKLF